ncbi:HCT, partial [Linum grandiflorum]
LIYINTTLVYPTISPTLFSKVIKIVHLLLYLITAVHGYDHLFLSLKPTCLHFEPLSKQKMKLRVIENSMVRPSEERSPERMWLSNMDLLQPKTHVRTINVYKQQQQLQVATPAAAGGGGGNFFDPKVLKDALEKTLVSFYPMAGRLVVGESGRVELDCNGEGVLFRVADADVTVDEVGEFLPSVGSEDQFVSQLVPSVDYSKGISSLPVCLLQVTRFKCGGVGIGVGINHTVADGQSAFSFINAWSDMARCGASHTAAVSPFLDRTILRARSPPTPNFHHKEYHPHPTMIIHNNNGTPKGPPRVEILNIKPHQIDTLKKNTIPKNDISTDPVFRYSTYEILAAHIWRCATKVRSLDPEQPTTLLISVDGRSRLNSPLPRGYFGNVIFHATPTALAGELVSEPMGQTVERIRQAISGMDDEYLRSAIDYLEDPDVKFTPAAPSPNVKLVSWMQLPVKNADFGWGTPFVMRHADFEEGRGHLLPRNDDGSLSLAICLEADGMVAFKGLLFDV